MAQWLSDRLEIQGWLVRDSLYCVVSLSKTLYPLLRPNKKNKCVSGNMSENFRWGRHTFF